MKPITALTDFSPISLNAVNYAADMACSLNAGLSLLHIILSPMAFNEVPYPPENITDLMSEAKEKILHLKDDLFLRTAGKLKIDTEVKFGTLITETEDYCSKQDPFAVVMGTQGSSAVERVFLGSNTIGLIKHLSWPLIVVPPEAKFNIIKKIGLACDLKKVDETIPITEIRSLVKEFNAELHILHAGPGDQKGYSAEAMEESRSLQNMLEDLNPAYHFLTDGNIEDVLSEFAEKNKLDLLIVVPKKHNIIDQLFHKSHSKKLVLHTHVPVMAVHE